MNRSIFYTKEMDFFETLELGKMLSKLLIKGDVIFLKGKIGTGKTHFARSLINSRMISENKSEEISSPTYNIINVYDNLLVPIWHVDLYRLNTSDELYELGLFSFLDEVITIIEWPEKMEKLKPKRFLQFYFEEIDDIYKRRISISFSGSNWEKLLFKFKE